MDKFRDTVRGRLHYIRFLNAEFPAVLHKSIRIISGDIHHTLMFSSGPGKHLILTGIPIAGKMTHIRDIHHPFHIVAHIAQIFFQNIFHNIAAQIADMGKMIYSGTTGIHPHLSFFIGGKFLYPFCQGVI